MPLGILDDERGMHALWWLLEGVPVDVVMGYDVLGSFDYLTVNFRDRALRVASGRYRPQPDRLVAAIALHVGHGVPLVEAFIDGRGPFPTALATGGSFGLWLPRNMAEA
ncbi:MAG: hypothetical protein GWO24_00160, partial [Akkermansiaceae bacterium]|nr:hypothetical protein [Akkermansiaceae bacterium]